MPPDETQPAPEPWEPQPGEGPKPYAAFVVYRDLGPHHRGLQQVATQLAKSLPLIKRWCRTHHWVIRANAWDLHVDQQAQKVMVDIREEMIVLHAATARAMMEKVQLRLTGGQGVDAIDANDLTASDLVRMMDAAAKLERLSRGVPTEVIETTRTDTMSPALQILMEDQELAEQAENLAIELAKRRYSKEQD